MDPKDPITPADNPADVVADAPVDPAGTGDGTDKPVDNPDPSKSTDSAADGDKKPTDPVADPVDPPAPLKLDSDLDDWAKKRGFPEASDDATKQAYQKARDEQREFTRTQQAAKIGKDAAELNDTAKDAKDKLKPKDDDPDDPLEARLSKVEAERDEANSLAAKQAIYVKEQVTSEEHNAIKDILMEKVDKAGSDEEKLKALDFWGSPAQLGDLLDIARSRLAKGIDNSADLDAAAQAERERIAKESNASSPGRSASSPPSDKTPEQERNERLKARYS